MKIQIQRTEKGTDMGLRTIIKKGDPSLKRKSRPVTDFNKRLHTLLDDMLETLIDVSGAGLAAPQVGVNRRAVIVVDFTGEEPEYIELINPEIMERDGEQIGPEGCLSLPNIWGLVTRPMYVKVKAQDRYGEEFILEADDFLARACCHECDHLEGTLFDEVADRFLSDEEIEALSAAQDEEDE